MTIVISDSSSLILITRLEILDLLIEVFGIIYIPEAVYVEAVEKGKTLKKLDAFTIEKEINDKKIFIEKIKNLKEKTNLKQNFNIHDGEAEAIVLYLEKKADLLATDDYRTEKVSKILKIKFFNTPAFLLRCFENKTLSKEKILLKFEKLSQIGWYKKQVLKEFIIKIERRDEKNG